VSNDTNPWCRSTPTHIYETSGCDEAKSTRLDIDLQNRSTHIDSVDRHHLGVDRHQYQPKELLTLEGAESTKIDRARSIPDSSVDRHSPSERFSSIPLQTLTCRCSYRECQSSTLLLLAIKTCTKGTKSSQIIMMVGF